MTKRLFLLLLTLAVILSACGTFQVSIEQSPTPTIDQGKVATIVAATLAAYPTATTLPGSPSVLPHSLYYWKWVDDQTGLGQIFRLERNALMNTQVTNEPQGVASQFDVSPLKGQLAYNNGKQLILVDANGWNRQVVAVSSASQDYLAWPHWSPDGRALAYANNGIYFYSTETGTSTLVLANDAAHNYSPRDFSPDGSKLLLSVSDLVHTRLGIYNLAAKSLTLLQPSEPADIYFCCSPVSWSSDSNHLYISEKVTGAGCPNCLLPGLWRYNADGTGTALLPGVDAAGTLIQNKTAAPWLDADGNLMFLYSAPGTVSKTPFSLVHSAPDATTDRTFLRPETFSVVNALWAPDGSSLLIVQNDGTGTNDKPANLILVPVDPSRPVVTLLPDASKLDENSLRWGP